MLTASYSVADMALLDAIAAAPTERQKLEAVRLYRQVQAMATAPRVAVKLEPARYSTTGVPCGAGLGMAAGFGFDDIQAIDAPEYMPTGGVLGVTCVDGPAYVYGSTAAMIPWRIRWAQQ